MSHRLICAGLLLVCAAAHADDFSVSEHVRCVRGYAPPQPCVMRDRVQRDGTHVFEFESGNTRTRFVGKPQTGWWSGRLDGQPAMGYELNRGHVVYSTTDLRTRFEWWSDHNQHGSY